MNKDNVRELLERTGIRQVHSSCKAWMEDPTTVRGDVSFSLAANGKGSQYDVVSEELVREFVERVETFGRKHGADSPQTGILTETKE